MANALSEPRSMAIACPNCGKPAVFVESAHEVPHFGRTIFTTVDCRACGFKLNDVIPGEFKAPGAFSVEVRKPKDLETKIIRSGSGTVRITKLGVLIEPGMAAEGFISNLEGLLDRVEGTVKSFLFSGDEPDRRKAEKKLKQLRLAREGKLAFQVSVLDPYGNSALIGPGVKQRKLSAAEVKKLKTGMTVLELRR